MLLPFLRISYPTLVHWACPIHSRQLVSSSISAPITFLTRGERRPWGRFVQKSEIASEFKGARKRWSQSKKCEFCKRFLHPAEDRRRPPSGASVRSRLLPPDFTSSPSLRQPLLYYNKFEFHVRFMNRVRQAALLEEAASLRVHAASFQQLVQNI